MPSSPWFLSWNYDVFRILFQFIPHSKATDELCKTLISTPLLSTWVFAFCFYRFWMKDDEQKARRRRYLSSAVIAFGVACLVTLVLRPWIYWPAPVLHPAFQTLFPHDLWRNGSANCFPSHSTLAYFTIAIGFWPLNRSLSTWLSTLALLLVSFPRVYVGGHYPIDVLFSCVLAIVLLVAVWRWPIPLEFFDSRRPLRLNPFLQDFLFFLWVFELGEGFHSVESIAGFVYGIFSP